MLVELSVMEQRYQAVLAVVQDGCTITEIAQRVGVFLSPRIFRKKERGGRLF
jgi:hypothetical protein